MDNSVPVEQGNPPASQEQQLSPEQQRETEAYVMGLSKILHGQKTRPQVLSMLKTELPPEELIPKIALLVNDQMEQATSSKGKKPSLETLAGAAQFLVGDLVEMGNAMGVFDVQSKEQLAPIVQNTMQTYIQRGLEEGTIDPVELQQKVEPLMPSDMRTAAMQSAQASGIPEAPNQMTAMETYARKRQQKGMMRMGGQQ